MTISPKQLDEFKLFIHKLVAVTGPLIKNYFYSDLVVDSKQDDTPVTLADRQAEQHIRAMIQQQYPNHGILGEEYGEHNSDAEFQWVLDPVDGTKSFVAGAFDFGTIIALRYRGEPILGAVHQPIIDELVIGDNQQTTCNGKVIRVTESATLADTIVLATDFDNIAKFQSAQGMAALVAQTKWRRTWGNCYGYTLVARGLCAVMLDPKAAIWDSMGVIPIIRGAGGVITDFHGNDPVDAGSAVACVPAIHQQVIALLNS